MKVLFFLTLLVFQFLANAEDLPPLHDKHKPKPKPKKPKPGPHTYTNYPTSSPTTRCSNTTSTLKSEDALNTTPTTSSAGTGLAAVLGGVAMVCVGVILAIFLRKPTSQHEPLPYTSDHSL